MHHTLIVANRTASTPVLLQEVEQRAGRRPTAFTLLIPDAKATDWSVADALKTLRTAAAGIHGTRATHIDAIEDAHADPYESVRVAVERGDYDDIVISTLPTRSSQWLKRDLPSRVEALGLPLTVITPPTSRGFSLFAKGPGSYDSGR